jgi:hypothetical protein
MSAVIKEERNHTTRHIVCRNGDVCGMGKSSLPAEFAKIGSILTNQLLCEDNFEENQTINYSDN